MAPLRLALEAKMVVSVAELATDVCVPVADVELPEDADEETTSA
jgi:hypothetical protein